MDSSKPLTEQAEDKIIQYIIDNDLPAGSKLPNEFELAGIFGIGRSTLREAVKALASRNVLEVRQGAGTFVAPNRMGVPDDPLGLTFIKDKQKLAMDLLDIRMAIEPRIASLAAMHATPQDIKKILAATDEVEQLILAGEDHMEKDIELHTAIAESSQNLVVPNLLPIIQHAISLFVNITNRQLRQETIDTHREIAQAIAQRDPLAASDAMMLHIVYNRNNLAQIYREKNSD